MSWDCDVDVHKKDPNIIHTSYMCIYIIEHFKHELAINYQVSLSSGPILPGGLTPGLVPGILGSQL